MKLRKASIMSAIPLNAALARRQTSDGIYLPEQMALQSSVVVGLPFGQVIDGLWHAFFKILRETVRREIGGLALDHPGQVFAGAAVETRTSGHRLKHRGGRVCEVQVASKLLNHVPSQFVLDVDRELYPPTCFLGAGVYAVVIHGRNLAQKLDQGVKRLIVRAGHEICVLTPKDPAKTAAGPRGTP